MRNRVYYKFLITFLFILGPFIYSIAAPHYGDAFDLVQPDGSKVPVLAWGDEFFQHIETPDGYTLIRNKETGWICYAELSADSSELIPSNRVYTPTNGLSKTSIKSSDSSSALPPQHIKIHRSSRLKKHLQIRQQLHATSLDASPSSLMPAAPSSTNSTGAINPLPGVKPRFGHYIGLTLLIDFSDQQATVPIDSIKDFVNKRGYTGFRNNGSVRDYYYDVSGGKVDYENVVVGYYRAEREKSYYDSRSAPFGTRAQELILEALEWLRDDGFDFSDITTYPSSMDASRIKILALNILYAGSPNQGWSEGLWPHQGRLNNIRIGDIYADLYQISNIGSSVSIGTFCHENGHMLFFWPDLYDYGGESGGVGSYCIMCGSGATNPVPPCAYLRDYSGWDAVTDITDMAEGTVLSQLPENINTTFVYRNTSNQNEMFYIEARRRIGRYRTLPDSGFLIWHVDRNGSNDYEQGTATRHYLVSLEQADNAFELELGRNSGRSGDCFRGGYKDRFDDATAPDAHWWDGSNSGMKIWNMSDIGDTMSFSIGELATTYYTIIASAGTHGSLTPSGKISAVAGSPLSFAILPDSGYTTDAITLDGSMVSIADTLFINNITSDHTIEVVFGLKAALSVVFPQEGDILYAGDTIAIMWRTRGITVSGIDASYSIDGGETFTPIQVGISAADTLLHWIVPTVESETCVIKIIDSDGSPTALTGTFTIRKKPSITVAAEPLLITVEYGKSKQQTVPIANTGTGNLQITATTESQVRNVLINELFVGSDGNGINDGIEIWNRGTDIDLSGWQLYWAYGEQYTGYYTFPEGFILKSGVAFFLYDKEHEANDSTAYIGEELMWSYSMGLDLSVSLYDAGGSAVDFFKTAGNPDRAPEGTEWLGNGVDITDSYVYRSNAFDTDSAVDWTCGTTGSLCRINAAQQVATHQLLTVSPLNGNTPGGGSLPFTLAIDATEKEIGEYYDTLVIHHNDPGKESPLRIPCVIQVTEHLKIRTERPRAADKRAITPTFIAAPNPVPPGKKVFFQYQPTGDERSGKLMIYSSVGRCLYSKTIDFTRVSLFNKQPIRFSWLPLNKHGKAYRQGSCLARLIVYRDNGSPSVFSTMIGLQ